MKTAKKSNVDKENNTSLVPPDQDRRELIISELDKNMLVEAAAGTGKTTSLVGRMAALLGTGECKDIRTMAAVTFTRKAAAELGGRFQIQLEKAVREARGQEKKNLERALASIEQCFIGTIHSFCARILRERPVEAKVDPAFEEIDEVADARLRREAWNEYVARLMVHDSDGILGGLDQLGLRLGDLESTFLRFADFPDVDDWPAPGKDLKPSDLEEAAERVLGYVAHMEALAPRLPREWGNDGLIPKFKRLPRIVSHYDDLRQPSQLMEVLDHFGRKDGIVQKEWIKEGAFTREEAKREKERWEDFRKEVAEPLIRDWYEYRYEMILRLMFEAREVYDELRHGRGQVNFQDLLMKAADLLRCNPHVREYYRGRFTHLLVDEFQDTDPIQAQVMMLLTATDSKERDWRKCKPFPGSLFIVGDPKQSIYRFRRADIVTYNEVKRIVCGGGSGGGKGLLTQLSTNFRSTGEIIEWVNGVFEPRESKSDEYLEKALRFPEAYSDESPDYVSLVSWRGYGNAGQIEGVHKLSIPGECSNKQEAVTYEADRIARTIRYALDVRMKVSRTRQEIQEGKPDQLDPSDFMIITRNRGNLSIYAQRLQEYGVPHQVTGGSALNQVDELKLLYNCLMAVIRRDDPVSLVASLRGELFGISDADLYAYKRAGGRFSYDATIPEGISKEIALAFQDTFARMKRYAKWLSRLPPVTALEKIVADLGLMVLAGSHDGGDVEAGSLAKALEILRGAQREMWSTAQVVQHLGKLVDMEESYDGISARSEEKPSVRIMNLHKAKGLEAPVVFLADPSGEFDHGVDLHIDRSGDRILGYMAVYGKKGRHRASRLAQPQGWEILAEKEKRFQRAEDLRLRYVAATRAGSAMIVTQREKNNHSNPWQYFAQYVPWGKEIVDPGPQSATARELRSISPEEVSEARENILMRLVEAERPTYRALGAKEYALSLVGEGRNGEFGEQVAPELIPEVVYHPDDGEGGMEWGEVIHLLLQLAMENPRADLLGTAINTLAERDLDPDLAEAAVEMVGSVMGSAIWKRALQGEQRLTEVPFQVLLEKGEPLPTLVRGSIDLVFKENGGWVLVDYKTDSPEGKGLGGLVEKYGPQVRLYARAWEVCTGESVNEMGIYFLRADSFVRLAG